MAIVLNFTDFSVKKGSGKNAVNSPEALNTATTPAQLQRFAENIMGKRFEKGVKKGDACVELFAAMQKKVGEKAAPAGKDTKKKPASVDKPKKKKESISRAKRYTLTKGKSVDDQPSPMHAVVFTEAIAALLGKKKSVEVERQEILDKAMELKLFERKPSKNPDPSKAFAWWCKVLKEYGWLTPAKATE